MKRLIIALAAVCLTLSFVGTRAHAQSASTYSLSYAVGSGPGSVTFGNTYYLNFGPVSGTSYYELDFSSSPDLPIAGVGFGCVSTEFSSNGQYHYSGTYSIVSDFDTPYITPYGATPVSELTYYSATPGYMAITVGAPGTGSASPTIVSCATYHSSISTDWVGDHYESSRSGDNAV